MAAYLKSNLLQDDRYRKIKWLFSFSSISFVLFCIISIEKIPEMNLLYVIYTARMYVPSFVAFGGGGRFCEEPTFAIWIGSSKLLKAFKYVPFSVMWYCFGNNNEW
jgi:hypothetical protein